MSELQESQRPISAGAKTGAGPAPKPNPSVNTNPAAVKSAEQGISGVNTATKPVSNPTQAVSAQPYTPVFTTDKIQHTKATRPKEYFDEQNRKNAEKKKQDNKNRKMILIIGAAIVGVLVLIGIIWLVVIKANEPKGPTGQNIPSIDSGSNEEVDKIQQYLQTVYDDYEDKDNADNGTNNSAKLEATNQATEEILAEGNNSDYASQIFLAQIKFYFSYGYYDEIIANADKIDVNQLTPEQKLSYYNCLALAYQEKGNQQKADEYYVLMFKVSEEVNGAEEYGE